MRLFSADCEALLVSRPNRFLMTAELLDDSGSPTGKIVDCHCPNPGRLLEFLLPGTRLILERRGTPDSPPRASPLTRAPGGGAKTRFTAAALYHRGAVVPLYAARANAAARELAIPGVPGIPGIVPELAELRSEVTLGRSRLDFLALDRSGTRHLIEVKACSLVEAGLAMFPDAPSDRAVKHLEELAALAAEGFESHVLFVVVHGNPEAFAPNAHTDPAFAAALARLAPFLRIHAALLRCSPDGEAELLRTDLPVNLSSGRLAAENRGSYLVALEIPAPCAASPGAVTGNPPVAEIGALGTVEFKPGWYVYCGSAQKNLSSRLARHSRRVRKNPHWHLDYLTPLAAKIVPLPILSGENLECALALSLREIGGTPVPSFGSSDCSCASHLYHFPEPPLKNRAFLDLLFRFRARSLRGE